jgi:hypothetical protein
VLGTVALAWWLWSLYCAYPSLQWNDTRLRAAFLLVDADPLYASPSSGLIHTWMYGPATPALHLPATLAKTPAAALLFSGSIHALITLATPLLVLSLYRERLGAVAAAPVLLALAAIPASSILFLQADALAVALVALGLIPLCGKTPPGRARLWLAAAATVPAAMSKQTAIAALPAQALFLGLAAGPAAAFAQLARGAALSFLIGGAALATWGWDALWHKLVLLPARLPFRADLQAALAELAPVLIALACAFVPLAIEARRRDHASRLILCVGACLTPPGIAAALREGGAINSLHALPIIVPTGIACAWLVLLRLIKSKPVLRLPPHSLAGIVAVVAFSLCMAPRLHRIGLRLPSPDLSVPRQAYALALRYPSQIWFPWHPLATRFASQDHHHDEDGLHVLQLAGRYPTQAHAFSRLPPSWRISALKRTGLDPIDWGVASTMHAENASVSQARTGEWTLLLREASPPAPSPALVPAH